MEWESTGVSSAAPFHQDLPHRCRPGIGIMGVGMTRNNGQGVRYTRWLNLQSSTSSDFAVEIGNTRSTGQPGLIWKTSPGRKRKSEAGQAPRMFTATDALTSPGVLFQSSLRSPRLES